MSYGRLVSKDIINDPAFSEMSEGAQIWALKLLILADDFGRSYGEPAHLVSTLSPMGPMPLSEVTSRLKEIGANGLIVFYEFGGRKYFYIPSWFQIQRFNSTCHIVPTHIPNPSNPPKPYIKGCMKICRIMLGKKNHDPDDHIEITALFPVGWESRNERDDADE